MAVIATNLTTSGTGTDGASFATASITPTGNSLVLAFVYVIDAAAPTTPTATGNGLTWVQIGTLLDSSGLRRGTIFRAMGASPSTGAVTFDFAGDSQAAAVWSVVELSGVDTSGTNGSGAVVQIVTAASVSDGASQTIALSTLTSTSNVTVGFFAIPRNSAATPQVGTGFVQLGQINTTGPNISMISEWKAAPSSTSDVNVVGNWVGLTLPSLGAALEVGTGSAPAADHNALLLMGVG